jgi:plasmid stabilization system protein ParE
MNVFWSAASVRHLKEIVEYIQPESVVGAVTIRRRILQAVWRAGQMPYSGRVGRVEKTREAVVPGSPFIVVYQISAQAVEILGVWHATRLWPESF